MADNKKRKSRDTSNTKLTNSNKTRKTFGGKTKNGKKKTKSTGPRLPSALRKQLDTIKNPNLSEDDDVDLNDEEIDSDEGEVTRKNDLYEYEEVFAEEESTKNRRFDPVENFEYQLPDKFKDEDVLSEDDEDEDEDENGGEESESEDDGRHARMLRDITGISTEAFEGKKRKQIAVVSEAYPESEFNPTRDLLSGDAQISFEDLLDPLRGTPSYSKIRKGLPNIEKKGQAIQPPLPKPDRERLERGVAYDFTKKDITKWEPLIKRNREASTLYFNKGHDVKFPTVGVMASEFTPRTEFEKTMASLMQDDQIVDAYKNDGAKLLELNKISVEDVKERQHRLAKMRSVLFMHEIKRKHIKKIKSKTYHRLKKKDRMKAASFDLETDPEAARELAEKQERERAVERMTLMHKNKGKWAKRVLERGLDKQDEGTKAAIQEQLHKHNLLTRKINSVKDDSSSDDSSYEDDEDLVSSDDDGASKLLSKAKEKTLKLMDQGDEIPDSGVFSLPFMVRGMEKRKEAANEEAKHALEEYEISSNQLDKNPVKAQKDGSLSGRRFFGSTQKKVEELSVKHRPEIDNYGSDNEDIIEENDDTDMGLVGGNQFQKDVNIDLDVLREGLESGHEPVFESFGHVVVEDPGPRTTSDVSVYASGFPKKMKSSKDKGKGLATFDGKAKSISGVTEPFLKNDELDDDSDTDSGGQMIDGMLSLGTKQTYELPSNEELIRRAFAGDDVVEEFEKAKEDALNEENPEPEEPLLLPGWGNWSGVQKKKGLPSWMLKEHAEAKRKREAALKKRKDARLNHVIISEKPDKKAAKLYTQTVPFPYKTAEDYDRSNRMPIGSEYNPATVAGALIRPDVVKEAGMIIDPIKFEEVDPHERGGDQGQSGRKQKTRNKRSSKKPKSGYRT